MGPRGPGTWEESWLPWPLSPVGPPDLPPCCQRRHGGPHVGATGPMAMWTRGAPQARKNGSGWGTSWHDLGRGEGDEKRGWTDSQTEGDGVSLHACRERLRVPAACPTPGPPPPARPPARSLRTGGGAAGGRSGVGGGPAGKGANVCWCWCVCWCVCWCWWNSARSRAPGPRGALWTRKRAFSSCLSSS